MSISNALIGARILIVEDDPLIATTFAMVFENAGAVIVGPFSDQTSALRGIELDIPGVALLDVNIIGGNSYGIAAVLAARGIPYAFVTGQWADEVPAHLTPAGFLQKPTDSRSLIDLIARMIRGAQLP